MMKSIANIVEETDRILQYQQDEMEPRMLTTYQSKWKYFQMQFLE